MKKFVSVVSVALLMLSQHAIAGEGEYSLSKPYSFTSSQSFSDNIELIKPDYSLHFVKPSLRLTLNPNISFDGKMVRGDGWAKFDFPTQFQYETPINYSLNDDKKRRQFLESIPFLPYFHFENKNSSAGILIWNGTVNTFWKLDF